MNLSCMEEMGTKDFEFEMNSFSACIEIDLMGRANLPACMIPCKISLLE